jgi:thiol-disulfide isomerase/thioredoxin
MVKVLTSVQIRQIIKGRLMNLKARSIQLSVYVAFFSMTAILLSACGSNAAAELKAVVDAQTQSDVAVAAEVAQVETQVEGNVAEIEGPSSSPEAEEEVVADESIVEASVEEVRAVPVLVPGDPQLKSTDPATFQIASGRIQLVEFFAFWCPTCKRMAPAIHGLEDIYGEQVNFVYLDQDDPATASFREAFNYRYQPEFYLLNPDGDILGSWIGYFDGAILQEAIEQALQNASS